jgi:hypothetical protein
MSDPEMKDTNMDRLLKKVLKDDLPPEIEEKMKRRFIHYRDMEKTGPTASGIGGRLFSRIGSWPSWIPAREALAFSSLVMICLGGFLHVSGHRNAMADTLSFLSTSVTVSDQLLRVTSMECRLRVSAGNEGDLQYTIRWLSPDTVRVDVHRGEDTGKTLWITDTDIVVDDRTSNSFHEYTNVEQISDPLLEPAWGFLTPEKLSEAVYGKWVPKKYGEPHGGQRQALSYINGEGKVLVEMTVDSTSNLPLSIKKYSPDSDDSEEVVEAHFVWNNPISPRLMVPKS